MTYTIGSWPTSLAASPSHTTHTKPTPNPPTFPFLNLPPELRLQVYSHILPKSVRISPARPSLERSMHPWALTFVSRAIRDEVLSALYANAVFHLGFYGLERGFQRKESMAEASAAWLEGLDAALGGMVLHLVLDFKVEVRKKRVVVRKMEDLPEQECLRRANEIAHFGYNGGWARDGYGLEELRDEVGEWEVLWRSEKVREAKKDCFLDVLRFIDSQGRVVGLGKEGIWGLVAAYRDDGTKDGASRPAVGCASNRGQRGEPAPADRRLQP